MKALVTGGAGFIGSNLSLELIERGHNVTILDNFSTGKRENIEGFLDQISLIEGDLSDFGTVRGAVEGADYVFHLGALPSIARSIQDPLGSHRSNSQGTLNVLLAARDTGVKRIIYASSTSVCGNPSALPMSEDMKPDPLSPYAAEKLMGEYYCKIFFKLYGLGFVALRYFNVFGPRQDPHSMYSSVIPKFINEIKCRSNPVIFGDGEQTRDFTFVSNVVQANLLACKSTEAVGEIINIGCGTQTSINSLVNLLSKVMSIDVSPEYNEPRIGEIRFSVADISKAKRCLGYSPEIAIEEGLRKTYDWYLKELLAE